MNDSENPKISDKYRLSWLAALVPGLAGLSLAEASRAIWPHIADLCSATNFNHFVGQISSFMAAFAIGYICGQFPGGVMADRFGATKVIWRSLILLGISTIALGLMPISQFELGLRFLGGLATGFMFPACLKFLEARTRPAVLPIVLLLFLILPSIFGYSIKILFIHGEVHGPTALVILGCSAILVGTTAALLFKKPNPRPYEYSGQPYFKSLFSDRRLLVIIAASCLGFCSTQLLSVFMRVYFPKTYDLSFVQAGQVYAVFGLGGLLGTFALSLAACKFPDRIITFLMFCNLTFAASLSLLGLIDLYEVKIAALFTAGLVSYSHPLCYLALIQKAHRQSLGAGLGLAGALFQACNWAIFYFRPDSSLEIQSAGIWYFSAMIALALAAAFLFGRLKKIKTLDLNQGPVLPDGVW